MDREIQRQGWKSVDRLKPSTVEQESVLHKLRAYSQPSVSMGYPSPCIQQLQLTNICEIEEMDQSVTGFWHQNKGLCLILILGTHIKV